MRKSAITFDEAAELTDLYARLPEAQARVVEALRTEPPSHLFTSEARSKLLVAEQVEASIVRRIKEILHVAGRP